MNENLENQIKELSDRLDKEANLNHRQARSLQRIAKRQNCQLLAIVLILVIYVGKDRIEETLGTDIQSFIGQVVEIAPLLGLGGIAIASRSEPDETID